MAILVVVMAVTSIVSMQHSSYLLARADISHRQLELTTHLSTEINANVVQQLNSLVQGYVTKEFRDSQDRINRLFARMQRLAQEEVEMLDDKDEVSRESEEFSRLAEIHEEVGVLFELAMEAEAFAPATSKAMAVRALASQLLRTVADQLQPLIDDVVADEQAEIKAVEREMDRLRKDLTGLGVALVLGCLVLAVFNAWHINRSLAQPISALIQATTALSGGDLRKRLPQFQHDELGLLARHFDRMAMHLEKHRSRLETLNSKLEQKVVERTESLEKSNKRLQSIDESRKRFLANVSHELRTPLTAILGEIELSLPDLAASDSELAQSLLRVRANADYMRRRVQDLLLLARSEEGSLGIELQYLDLVSVLRDVCGQVNGIAMVEQVGVELQLVPRSAYVHADPSWIGQCLMGLIDNAVKFSMPGDEVVVALRRDGDAWRIDILDQGPGFEHAALPRLFDRYFQTKGGRMRGGSGLGLAIAHWIIAEHDGEILAENVPGGARVSIRLPVTERNDESAAM